MQTHEAWAAPGPLTLTISLASDLDWASVALVGVRAVLVDVLGEEDGERFALACGEAVTNAIVHAHKRDGRISVDLTLAVDERRVEATILDHGEAMTGFTPSGRDSPYEDRAVEHLPESGVGLWLVEQGADSVRYETSEEGNRLVLTIARPPRAPEG